MTRVFATIAAIISLALCATAYAQSRSGAHVDASDFVAHYRVGGYEGLPVGRPSTRPSDGFTGSHSASETARLFGYR